jgi:hypothetical protein
LAIQIESADILKILAEDRLPSGAQMTDHHPILNGTSKERMLSVTFEQTEPPMILQKDFEHDLRPSGDQTGPKQLLLGVSLKTLVKPLDSSRTAIRRTTSFPPAGEIVKAIF